MRWTAARARVEELMAPSVASRIGLHVARYRDTHMNDGRGWITVDGEQIVSFDTRIFNNRVYASPTTVATSRAAEEAARRDGIFAHFDFTRAIDAYPNLAIDEALASTDPIVRGLAMLDRRLGKRRLAQLTVAASEPPFVRMLLEIRRSAEGLSPQLR